MSKSLNNHIGIQENPIDMFGKIMSIPDKLIPQYCRYLTDKTEQDIQRIKKDMQDQTLNPRDIKVELGKYLVSLFHSSEEAEQAYSHFQTVFSKKAVPDNLEELLIDAPKPLVSLLTEHNICPSKKEIYRLIDQGAISIDGEKCTSANDLITPDSSPVLKVGKRRFYKIITAKS